MTRIATFSERPDVAALLAADPGNRAPLYWEIARPCPPPSLAAEVSADEVRERFDGYRQRFGL